MLVDNGVQGGYQFVDRPKPNFELSFADDVVCFSFVVKKTIVNHLKYWLFCKFFPFKITRWD